MAITTGSLRGRMIRQVREKWGQWVGQEYQGKNDTKLVILSAYQPIETGQKVGKITVSAQQYSLCLKQYKTGGYSILLTGDFNEVLGDDLGGMSKLASEIGLLDLMQARHSSPPPATYARGTRRLDYALGSPQVYNAMELAGYEPFNSRIYSDHKGYSWISTRSSSLEHIHKNSPIEQNEASQPAIANKSQNTSEKSTNSYFIAMLFNEVIGLQSR